MGSESIWASVSAAQFLAPTLVKTSGSVLVTSSMSARHTGVEAYLVGRRKRWGTHELAAAAAAVEVPALVVLLVRAAAHMNVVPESTMVGW